MITIEELKNKLNAGIYKSCGLYTMGGQKIIGLNSRFDKYETNKKEILNALNNPEFTDGLYLIKCKVTYTGGKCDEFTFNKGNIKATNNPQPMNNNTTLNIPQDFAAAMEHPAVKLSAQITELEIENEALQQQIEELNEYVKELEEKVNAQTLSEIPQPPTAFESAKSFLTELATMAAPLIDQHYQLKAQQLEIEKARLNVKPSAPAQAYQAPEVKKEIELEQKVKNWINSKTNDTELFNNLTAIYLNSPNLQTFAELLNEYNPAIYEECKQAVR